MKSLMMTAMAATMALTVGACSPSRQDRDLSGAAIGGVAGALVGGAVTGRAGGALAGAAIGAVGGAVVADATRPRYRSNCYIDDYGQRYCR